jgi:trimethylamine---corrinoid protein Co-methyltransferase
MHSKTTGNISFPSTYRLDLLSESQIGKIQSGTLTLLEEVGVQFPSRKALEIFSDHGAIVDMDKKLVRIPSDLVHKAMSTAPRSFVLGGREERFDLLLDGNCSYLCQTGTGVHVMDLQTRQKRSSRKKDVARMARVCDALPLISFVWSMVTSQDHGRTAPLHDCHAMLTNTLKHVRGATTVFPQLAPHIVEMATVVSGSDEIRRRRPPVNANICTISPLAQDKHGIESALIYAEAGIPVSFMAMTTMSSTAPATPLGALVVGDAEAVSGMVLLQLAYPGTPVFHSIMVSLMDPRTGGFIEQVSVPVKMIATQLAHAWGVPSLGGGTMSVDAPEVGWQAGMEGGMGSTFIPLCGAEITGFMGLLGGAMIHYPEELILDHEICQTLHDLLYGFDFKEADMALEVIKNVGPRNHFLMEDHTLEHVRDFRLSPLLRQEGELENFKDPREVALEEFKRIDSTHRPKPLSDEILSELDRILAAADQEAKKIG